MTSPPMALLNPTLLRVHALLSIGCSSLLIIVWALTARGEFWPAHAMLALALLLAIHGWAVLEAARPALRHRLGGSRPLTICVGVAAAHWLYLVALWAEGGGGSFWPGWPLLGLVLAGALIALHVALSNRRYRATT